MVLGFKTAFAQFVREGSKTHSIREDPNDRWKVGVAVDAFVNPRQKTMERLMPRTWVLKTEGIGIRLNPDQVMAPKGVDMGLFDPAWFQIEVDGVVLDESEMTALAHRDGFRGPEPLREMMKFWRGRLPFEGKIIHWTFPGAKVESVHVEPTTSTRAAGSE